MNGLVKQSIAKLAAGINSKTPFKHALLNKQAEMLRANRKNVMKTLREIESELRGVKTGQTAQFEQYLQPNDKNMAQVLNGIAREDLAKIPVPGETRQDKFDYVFEQFFYNKMRPWRLLDNVQKYNHIKPTSNTTFKVMDIENSTEWYPQARKLKRKIIMHVGPTNSGKTYNALKRLEDCEKGYYAGPLRLLAREVYEKLRAKNLRCNLITGEEIEPDVDDFGNISGLSSGTVEMISFDEEYDVVVLDEIQMISDDRRGWAWTNVLLGCQAKEIHLCGEVSAVPLVKKIVKLLGDDIEINEYNRLGELEVSEFPITQLNEFRKGDCIICFSKKRILDVKAFLENKTDLKCGVVYGALPPETRTSEAAKFNNGTYDVLVASDAVGMGLNLDIQRIVFTDLTKFDGGKRRDLSNSQIKQIGGRAGRFGFKKGSQSGKGFITAIDAEKLDVIGKSMKGPIEYLPKAALWIPDFLWVKYFSMFPSKTKMVDIFNRFELDLENLRENRKGIEANFPFFVSAVSERKLATEFFDKFGLTKDFSIMDQLKMINAPLKLTFDRNPSRLTEYDRLSDLHTGEMIKLLKQRSSKSIIDFPKLLNFYNTNESQYEDGYSNSNHKKGNNYNFQLLNLKKLEILHSQLMLYLWLGYRYPKNFIDYESVLILKSLTESKISKELDELRNDRLRRNEFMFA